MNREEFIRQLRIALSGSVNHIIVEDNVRYYEDYIDMEIRKGKTEQQVLEELGNPRLIAKTIIETNKTAGTTENYDAVQDEDSEERDWSGMQKGINRIFTLPMWVLVLCAVLLVLLLLTIATTVLTALLPFILPVILIVIAARLIHTLWR